MPAWSFLATVCALAMFSVNKAAARPYEVSFAFAIASASVENLLTTTTGPKISSLTIDEFSSAYSRLVLFFNNCEGLSVVADLSKYRWFDKITNSIYAVATKVYMDTSILALAQIRQYTIVLSPRCLRPTADILIKRATYYGVPFRVFDKLVYKVLVDLSWT